MCQSQCGNHSLCTGLITSTTVFSCTCQSGYVNISSNSTTSCVLPQHVSTSTSSALGTGIGIAMGIVLIIMVVLLLRRYRLNRSVSIDNSTFALADLKGMSRI